MVLFYLFPVSSEDQVPHPYLLGALHKSLKSLQLGLLGGCGLGLMLGLRTPGVTPQIVATSMTRYMGYGAGLGICYGPIDWFNECLNSSWSENKRKVFEIQRSVWHNRLDTLTLLGSLSGALFLQRSRIWTQLMGFTDQQMFHTSTAMSRYGGALWGGLFGTIFDLPLCIFYPVYVGNAEEIDVIRRHITMIPTNMDDEEEEEEAEKLLEKMRKEANEEEGEEG